MREYTNGSVIKRRGKWQGQLKYRKEPGGRLYAITKMLTVDNDPNGEPIKAYPDKPDGTRDNRGRATAERALRAWRDELVDAERRAEQVSEDARIAEEAERKRVTIADYVDRYIDKCEAMSSIEASTVKDYRTTAKLIRAEFGSTAVQDLTRAMVESFEVKLTRGEALQLDNTDAPRKPLKPATVGKVHRLLKMVCNHARDVGELIIRNPVDGVKPPKRERADKNALDAEGRDKLVDYIATHSPTRVVCGAALALFAGLGPGEACALRWRNVDLDKGTIRIDEAIGLGDGGAYKKTPKVESRRRTVPIPSKLIDVLGRRKALATEECASMGVALRGDMYVLGDCTGRYVSPTTLSKEWSVVAADEGYKGTKQPRVSFYDLRHTYATVLVASGADVEAVASLMGHSRVSMTVDVYADADQNAKRSAVDALEYAFETQPQASTPVSPTTSTIQGGEQS